VFGGSRRDPSERRGTTNRVLCPISPLTTSVEGLADGELGHGGAENGGAAVMGQGAAGGRAGEGADHGDAERRAELLGDLGERHRRTRVARFDTLLPDRNCGNSDGYICSPSGSRRMRLALEHGRMQRARQAHRQNQPTRHLSEVAVAALISEP
jgi:hypothetical protein